MKMLKFAILILLFSCKADDQMNDLEVNCVRSYKYVVCNDQVTFVDSTDTKVPRTREQLQAMYDQTFNTLIENCAGDSVCIAIRTKYRTKVIDCNDYAN